jgi:hypothetical protein
MRHRSHLPDPERRARSRLTQILHEEPFVLGSLVTMKRTCGKPGCKCTRGELHPGLYLALRVGGKRKMIHIPQPMQSSVRQGVAHYREAWRLMEQISESCLKRFLLKEESSRGKRPSRNNADDR